MEDTILAGFKSTLGCGGSVGIGARIDARKTASGLKASSLGCAWVRGVEHARCCMTWGERASTRPAVRPLANNSRCTASTGHACICTTLHNSPHIAETPVLACAAVRHAYMASRSLSAVLAVLAVLTQQRLCVHVDTLMYFPDHLTSSLSHTRMSMRSHARTPLPCCPLLVGLTFYREKACKLWALANLTNPTPTRAQKERISQLSNKNAAQVRWWPGATQTRGQRRGRARVAGVSNTRSKASLESMCYDMCVVTCMLWKCLANRMLVPHHNYCPLQCLFGGVAGD